MRAIKREDLENIVYYQTPKWLFDLLLDGKITGGAYTTYILMYDRTRLSAKNGWIDGNGDVYINYSYEDMKEDLKIKGNSNTQIQRNLKKLKELNLIDSKRNFNNSNTYYLNIYSLTQNVSNSLTQNVSNSLTQFVETNKNNLNKNNRINHVHEKKRDFSSKDEIIENTQKLKKLTSDSKLEDLDFFDKLFSEISNGELRFHTTNQKSCEKLLKTLSKEQVESYIRELYSEIKKNKDVEDINKVFTANFKKGLRQINATPKPKCDKVVAEKIKKPKNKDLEIREEVKQKEEPKIKCTAVEYEELYQNFLKENNEKHSKLARAGFDMSKKNTIEIV